MLILQNMIFEQRNGNLELVEMNRELSKNAEINYLEANKAD